MLNRLYKLTGGHERRNASTGALCLLSLLFACFAAYSWLAYSAGEAAVTPLQLVRLNINVDDGLVRIEVTADGSLSEATIEQRARGSETVIRVRGARSLLRPAYSIDDALARGVRTVSGEQDGEPFVDFFISRGEGSTVAQRVNFNRLVIAVASDFARLRGRRPAPAANNSDVARRDKVVAPRGTDTGMAATTIRVESIAKTDQIGWGAATQSESMAQSQQRVNNVAARPATSEPSALVASNNETFAFRGQTLEGELSASSSPARRLGPRGIQPAEPPAYWQTQNAAFYLPLAPIPNSLAMRLDPPGAIPGVWVPGTTTSSTDEVGGRILGPGILRPSFLFGAEFDDNFFYRSRQGRDVTTFTVAPRLEYEIPGIDRALRIAYEARLRRLSLGEYAHGHFLDLDARTRLSHNLTIAFRNHFARSALDPREYDPAGEVYIVGDTFIRNDVGMRTELAFNDRTRLAADIAYNVVRWGDRYIQNAPLFLDYSDLNSSLAVERDVSPDTTAYVSAFFTSTNTFVSKRPAFDGFNDRLRYGFFVGMRTLTSETGGLSARAGFEQSEFRHAPRANNLRTLVFDLSYRLNFTQSTNLELAALRKTQVSIFNLEGGNARLVSTGANGRLEHYWTEAFNTGFGANYHRITFPLAAVPTTTASGGVFAGNFAGRRRDDQFYGFAVDGSYRWSDLLVTRLEYSFQRRDSSLNAFTFNRNRISLVFEWGRRNNVRGRPF